MIQTSLWLPSEMHKKLTAGGTKLADEIRGRLEISLKADQAPRDPKTDELIDAVKLSERKISHDARWHNDRFAFEVLKAAINDLLSDYQPKSSEQAETVAKFQAKYGKGGTAESIGKIIAHAVLIASRDMQEE